MINVVLFEPEIPQNTGNIMRTCAGTDTKLHLIKPFGFKLDESSIKRSGASYVNEVDYQVYESYEEFKRKNPGTYFYITRYGKTPHSGFDYKSVKDNIYFIFGKESTGLPKEILRENLDNCFRLPMTNKVRSLNLANTVCVVVYEALRQFNYNDLWQVEPFKGEDYLTKE